jgi:hypothetical protein
LGWFLLSVLSSRFSAAFILGYDRFGLWDYRRFVSNWRDGLRVALSFMLFIATAIFFYHSMLAINLV